MPGPDFSFETAARDRGAQIVCGVDEVGRGPLAGPVMAAAVVLDPDRIPEGLNDSKLLSPARREILFAQLTETARIGLGSCSVDEIDHINILQASYEAMRRAIADLDVSPDYLLIDGNRIPDRLHCAAQGLVKGDGRCLSIAAASVVAKVTRDRLMRDLAQHFPGYGWETNMGYGSKRHKAALLDLGVTPHHRRSFRPVRDILCRD